MYLKSVEIHGFKSFANKIILNFESGITGIVGPNGSGKSNVADAVRWVLGEQSAKQLRGAKMEDVIFSGTELKKAQSFAYVAITMDNSDHVLPIAYDEVTVARRVYRSGESEYLINGSSCRLKDVQELFLDTGIIGQGQIEKIISGKPEERRELFDEAAGITKFKKRKAEAFKNLNEETANLNRVKDILSELERQVEPLFEQAETAKKYLTYRDELKKYETVNFIGEYDRTEETRAKAKEDEETGQLIISGMGELHLEVLTSRLLEEFNIKAKVGKAQVTYRESIEKETTHTQKYSKIISGKENTAELTLKVLPLKRGEGNKFSSEVKGYAQGQVKSGGLPLEVLSAIENTITSSFSSGIRFGYPCVDVEVILTDAVYKEESSTVFAFESCVAMCMQEALLEANPTLLEPYMNVEIVCPKDFVGDAMNRITQRGGLIISMEEKGEAQLIHAKASMEKMFGFSTDLRSATQGRASFTMFFSHFEVKS